MYQFIDRTTVNTYQCRIRALQRQVESLKNGEAMLKLRASYESLLSGRDRTIKRLELELADAHARIVTVRKYWSEIFDDVDRECRAKIGRLGREMERLKKRILEAERQRDEALDRLRERTKEYYETAALLEEEREKNQKLTAQVNRDFENSSVPSSMQVVRKKIPNTREKTGRRPGGQPGHPGHPRKKHAATEVHEIPAPKEYAESTAYAETGRIVSRQMVEVSLTCRIIEYRTKEYREKSSGHRVHAPFPEGYVNEVNYGGSVKALAFLLANECNVSHAKVRRFLKEASRGELEPSIGMINGLCEEFSNKSAEERKKAIAALMGSPVMNLDFTNANVNGGSAQVLILASPDVNAKLFVARESKGHDGIKGTPAEGYCGTMTHDHDTTFYSYGQRHQECMQHNVRYLKGSVENEPDRRWNGKMLDLIREMLHYRNGLEDGGNPDADAVADFEKRYDEILAEAETEYEEVPPSDYYREGYRLYRRLAKYRESQLLFLHDLRVPTNNSVCERLARVYKRKQKQATVFRSQENLEKLCDSLSVVYSLRPNAEDLFGDVTDIFNRKRSSPKRRKKDKKTETAVAPC